jgi:hypothetical protein
MLEQIEEAKLRDSELCSMEIEVEEPASLTAPLNGRIEELKNEF